MINVVIVEDEPSIAELHSHFVEQLQEYQVVGVAGNLATAKALVSQTHPDLVIVDNFLPDGRGVELVYQWLAMEQRPECILVTAANDVTTVQVAHRYGAFDYIVKPVDYTRLQESLMRFAKLRQTVDHQQVLRQTQLDGLFHPELSKSNDLTGLDPFMLASVIDLFTHTHIEHTASSVAECLGVSKSTARRYLDKGVEQEQLVAFLAHGKVGRPTRVYSSKALTMK